MMSEAVENVAEEATDKAEDVGDEAKEKAGMNGGGSSLSRLIVPAAAAAGTLVTGYVAKRAPDLLREHVMPRLQQARDEGARNVGKQAAEGAKQAASGRGGVVGQALSNAIGGGSGGGGKKTRRLPIQRWTDVAVPVEQAYEGWTKFEDFPKFMHRVLSVEEKDNDDTVTWEE